MRDLVTAWDPSTGRATASWSGASAITALTTAGTGAGRALLLVGDSTGSVHILELRQPTLPRS